MAIVLTEDMQDVGQGGGDNVTVEAETGLV